MELLDERPKPGEIWEHLMAAMLKPREGDPHRPGKVQARQRALVAAWRSKLHQIAVVCELADPLAQIEPLLGTLTQIADAQQQSEAAPADPGDLAALPQLEGEVWQADLRLMPAWVTAEGQPQRPWVGMVANRSEGLVLAHTLTSEPPQPDRLWQIVAAAALWPAVGEPHRPGVVEVGSRNICNGFSRSCSKPASAASSPSGWT